LNQIVLDKTTYFNEMLWRLEKIYITTGSISHTKNVAGLALAQ